MELFNTKIKLLIAVVVLALIGVAIYFLIDGYSPFNGKKATESGIAVTQLPISATPSNFPSNLPIEEGAQLLQNFQAAAPDNRAQSTQVYTTTKTLPENVKIYTDYMKNNGWQILSEEDKPAYKMLYGSKGDTRMQVDLTEQSPPLTNTIGISVTTLTK